MTGAASSGAQRHHRALESLYASAPVNALFASRLEITGEGAARITFNVVAEGRWVSGRKRVFVAESRLVDAEGDEIGRGTGTFMRSHIPLSSLPGYLAEG